ncbi:MAG: peptidase domain-containing ABC transporter, partial [Halieaceae bacterium]|nr:peptidase domain-containing ABC transporter [Halieaceae bacterium]
MTAMARARGGDDGLASADGRGVPLIMQAELSECGLACLAMIVSYHGYRMDMNAIRRRFPVSSQGTSLQTLIKIADKLNLSSRALKLSLDRLDQLQLPCVLHWDMNHFVVLVRCSARGADIQDPAVGRRRIRMSELSEHFTGVALELYPASDFTVGEERQMLRLSQFWSTISGLKRSLAQILFLSLMLQIFALVAPFYMQTVVDDVLLHSNTDLLLVLALGFGLLLLIEVGTKALRQLVVLDLSSRLNIQMAANLFRHLIRLPLEYFQRRHLGDVVSRFASLERVRELLTTSFVTAVVDGIMALITLVAMMVYDVKLTLAVLVFVAAYVALRVALYRPLHRLSEESLGAHATAESSFMESVRAIQAIKIFQKESDRQNQWQNLLAAALNKDIQVARLNIGFDTASTLLFGLENIVVIYLAALAVLGNTLSLGMLYAFMAYKQRFLSSVDNLVANAIDMKMVGVHLSRLADIAYTEKEKTPDGQRLPNQARLRGDIVVDNVSFSYTGAEAPVFAKVSLAVSAGESVAIVGPSGSGKTTLLKCMMGLLNPTAGEIRIDGRPLERTANYRQSIAGVMQDDQLLSGTIADNIACFDLKLDMAWIQQCAEIACIASEIESLPMQYNTLVGDLGSSLSGGQKQRILLARALYRRPIILFMDEATSHVDAVMEAMIISRMRDERYTRVSIAHR